MLEINMNPSGIIWEKEDTVLKTTAGVVHTCKGEKIKGAEAYNLTRVAEAVKKPLSKNFVQLDPGYSNKGFDVCVVKKDNPQESYVSIVTKIFYGAFTVGDYQKIYGMVETGAEAQKRYANHLIDINQPYRYARETEEVKVDTEVRVYPNKKVAVLFRLTYQPDGHSRYFMLKAEKFAEKGWSLFSFDDIKNEEAWFGDKTKYPYVIEISNEDEVQKNALKNTIKSSVVAGAIRHNCDGCDLHLRIMSCVGRNWYRFDKETRQEINKLMGVFSEEEKDCRSMFDSKYTSTGDYWRATEDGISNPIFLDRWTVCHDSAARAKKKKAEKVSELWSTVRWGASVAAGKGRSICWERRKSESGDLIIAAYHDADRSDWETKKVVFVYDVKKKTRQVIAEDNRGNIKTLIPALNQCILDKFEMQPKKRYDSGARDYRFVDEGPEQSIVGGISIKELFAGTNIAWILENEKEFGEDMYYLFKNEQGYWGEAKIQKVQEEIREGGRIGVVALCILATTGNAMLEQLLKSKMFRMYFLALANEAEAGTIFWDTSKKTRNRYDSCAFPYSSKGKNLKEMFGMSLAQLRMADKAIEIVKTGGGVDSSGREKPTKFEYRYPKFGNVAKVLGVERLSSIGAEMFERIIAITKKEFSATYSYWNRADNIFNVVNNRPLLTKYLEHNTPSERLELIERFQNIDEVAIFEDYLGMRENMAKLQEQKPEENIFDDKTYPYKVGKAVKFIRFMPGMKFNKGWYYSETTVKTSGEFVKAIKESYARYATERGSVLLEANEKGIVGAIIKMNPIQHMNFLHDEMSKWYATYRDPSKVEKFKTAARRVKDYEWSDEEGTGLCIIAPKDPSDLREEGGVLHHCVASYVDPIIAGSHNIMFIRRTDMVNEPYYTLDINGSGEVTEIHGYANCNMEDSDVDKAYAETGREVYSKHFDIKGFLSRWAKAMKGKVKKESLRESYGKLEILD